MTHTPHVGEQSVMTSKIAFFLHFYALCEHRILIGTDGNGALLVDAARFRIPCSKDFWLEWDGGRFEYHCEDEPQEDPSIL